jgi:hypothetical protein
VEDATKYRRAMAEVTNMDYPADFELDAPGEVANWRPLVHWLLGLPHMLIANVLSNLGGVIGLISWFAIVFTGRLPESLANLQCLVIRYQVRTFSYVLWLREPYPPFDFAMTPAEPGGDPARVDLRPQLEDRNRVTVGFRLLLAIPIFLFLAVVALCATVVALVGFFAVLFTGRWPDGMRRFIVGAMRLGVRANAYVSLLVDDYPPFSLD